jgi:hypothetical protein
MEFNVQPYYDDFDSNAKENNYLRLLFRPGYAVQARELTQIQSLLQNQIKSFADHVFQDGSPVIGGNISFDNSVTYIKLEETFNNQDLELDEFVDKVIIRSPDSLVQAKTIAAYFPSGGTPTLLIKYLTGNEFQEGEIFTIAGTNKQAKLIASNATGKGSAAFINDGIFYVDGYFIQVQSQSVVLDAYSQNANVKVGLEISDEIVDHLIDTSLLDPAQDSFNYQAPGSDRYQINLNLSTRPLATAVDESSFFELMRVENGAVTKQIRYPIYSELEKTLARRTYDESGDYTVVPFKVSTANSADVSKFTLEIEPGKAYVKGYEFETIGKLKLEVDKPRSSEDERTVFEAGIDTSYGNYVQVKRVFGNTSPSGFLDINNIDQVDLHCVASQSVAAGVRGGTSANFGSYSNTKIGTARIRNFKRYQSQGIDTVDGANTSVLPSGDSNGTYNLYVTDIDIKPMLYKLSTGSTSNTIVLPTTAPSIDGAYTNMTITMMPFRLDVVANANVNISATRWIHRHGANTTNLRTRCNVGDTIRFNGETRIATKVTTTFIVADRPWSKAFTSGNLYGDRYLEKQLPITSNVVNQTRTITRYDGSSRTAYLDLPFDENSVPTQNAVVQINPKFKDVESFIKLDFSNMTTSNVTMSANVAQSSKNQLGDVWLKENDYKSLIFRLPQEYVQRSFGGSISLQNVDYYHNKYIQSISVVSNSFTIEPGGYLTSGSERIDWLPTNSNIEDNLIVVVRNKGTSTTVSNGEILRLNSNHVNLNGLGDGIIVDLSTNNLATGVSEVSAYVVVRQDNVETNIRRKTLVSNTSYTVSPLYTYPTGPDASWLDVQRAMGDVDPFSSTPQTVARIDANNGIVMLREIVTNIGPGDSLSLYVPDVLRVRRILKSNGDLWPSSTNYFDVTDHFTFDGGQKDEIYDHATITLKQGYPTPNAKLLIHLDYYKHSEDSSNTFFSVDSYTQEEYESGTIPIHYSRKYGRFNLRDSIDFRPTRKIGDPSGSIISGKISDPDSIVVATFKYWLSRIDKLVLTKTKEFKILKGTSAVAPVPPDDDSDSMTLYTIYLPPYVHRISDIGLKYNEAKRYTMKDLAALDKRIQRVEYYTSLNNIENRTLADPAFYNDNTKKEKYGLVGESFQNYDIADYKNRDFSVSKTAKGITAKTKTRIYDIRPYSLTNTKRNGKTLSLAFTEQAAISQPLASNTAVSVQPFLFASFIGNISLSPEIDYWVSEELRPEIIKAPAEVFRETRIQEVVREIVTQVKTTETIIVIPSANTNTQTQPEGPGTDAGTGNPVDVINLPNDVIIPITTDDPRNPDPVVAVPPSSNDDPEIITTTPPNEWTGIDESLLNGIIFPMPILDFGAGFLPWMPTNEFQMFVPSTGTATTINYDQVAYTEPTYAPPSGGGGIDRDVTGRFK